MSNNKSVGRKLSEASALSYLLRLSNAEVEYFNVGYGLYCKLTPSGFQRVFIFLKLRNSQLKNEPDCFCNGEVRYSFVHRGCEFWCLVPVATIEQWLIDCNRQDAIAIEAKQKPALLGSSQRRLRLPAPEVIDA